MFVGQKNKPWELIGLYNAFRLYKWYFIRHISKLSASLKNRNS